MSGKRIYVVERRSKRSFDIALFTTLYLILAVIVVVFGITGLPLTWDLLLWLFILPASVGFGLSWIAKIIEKQRKSGKIKTLKGYVKCK